MSHIAIKDLNEHTTLDQTAMGELHGGKGGHCPKGAPGYYLPGGDQPRREHKSLDLQQMGAGLIGQIDDLLPGGGPSCSPLEDVK